MTVSHAAKPRQTALDISSPTVEREWNDFFLAMAVQKNLLSETHIPQAGDDGPQVCRNVSSERQPCPACQDG